MTWIHNTDALDAMICIDEWECKKGLQVLADKEGHQALVELGLSFKECKKLSTPFGISSICNILGAIKAAKHFRLGAGDVIFTIATDLRTILINASVPEADVGPVTVGQKVTFNDKTQQVMVGGKVYE